MMPRKLFGYVTGILSILLLSTYAGCASNSSSDVNLSVQSSNVSNQSEQNSISEQMIQAQQPQQLPMKDLTVQTPDGNLIFHVQVADNYSTRMIGLMFATSLPKDEGMIFLFDQEQPLTFWMKNTLIPLDMVFIDKNWKVVSIQKNAEPCTSNPCATYPSLGNAQYVLEINAGLSDKLGIQPGASMTLQSS